MMMTRITVQPDAEPITLDEAKAHCRIENALDNLYLSSLIMTARQSAERVSTVGFRQRDGSAAPGFGGRL